MKLKNVKFELVELEEGSIKELKPRLPYQMCFFLGDLSEYNVDLRGKFFFTSAALGKYYALARTKRVEERGEYTKKELGILLRILEVAILDVKNPRLSEILIRALDDETCTAAFYDQVVKDKLVGRIVRLKNNESTYLPGRKLRPSQYDRQRYSIYQLLQDLVSDKAEIFIDKDFLETRYTKISASKSLESDRGFWGSIVSVRGNQERANLSLLVKDNTTDDLSSLCVVKDGAPWLTEMIVKVNSPRLRSRLYGAKVVEDKFIGEREFYLNLTSIPVIGKRYLRGATKEAYLRSCFNAVIQEFAYKMALSMTPVSSVSPAKRSSATEKTEGVKCYVSQGIGFSFPRSAAKAKIWIEKNIHDFNLETRKKEYDKAKKEKRDLAFRYLMSKKVEWGNSEEIEGYQLSVKRKDIKVRVSDD